MFGQIDVPVPLLPEQEPRRNQDDEVFQRNWTYTVMKTDVARPMFR